MKTTASDLSLALRVGSHVEHVYFVEPGPYTASVDGREHDSLEAAIEAALDRRANDPNYDRPTAGAPGLTLGDTTPVYIDRRALIRHAAGGATDTSVLRWEYSQAEALAVITKAHL